MTPVIGRSRGLHGKHWTFNQGGSNVVQRRSRRWLNIETILDECLAFAGYTCASIPLTLNRLAAGAVYIRYRVSFRGNKMTLQFIK